ncbi:anion permease [Georhizobium profundi]|uniref:Phosphate transporter n=1 Tax=Georhizobium profundi TaxID=2341112 RepID=A0A3Q8XP05_9HYPH|nr:inorganic phosphate transporter [Georhizobium profundi]AZN71960.1 anion permease [Georhizobium profundi]
MAKSALDKDLNKVVNLETATGDLSRSLAFPGIALVFLLGAMVVAAFYAVEGPLSYLVIIASVIAGYMALNIGANDVANNMGPAVGSRALTMAGAIAIAVVCESAGALLAGGDVVKTISSELLLPAVHLETVDFIVVMTAALLSSALWINLATYLGAPVSTTHSVVGGVIGAGVAAAGFSVVAWPVLATIVASWVISPVLGGVMAAGVLAFANATILEREDKIAAARIWVPVLISGMAAVFAMYLTIKGLSRIWSASPLQVLMLGAVFAVISWMLARPWVMRRSIGLENRSKSINGLFRLPLIFAAALLSFAHGANDVANAVGPLAAIVAAAGSGSTDVAAVALPLWVLAIGAVGIALGLALFGPRLIRLVGEKITKMNEIRAYCVAFAAATTVLIASWLGLPVSSTHIAIGAVFGVGFLREATSNRGVRNPAVQPYSLFLNTDRLNKTPEEALANFQKRERRRLVRRQHGLQIAAAWVITVPAAGLLSALLYWLIGLLIVA